MSTKSMLLRFLAIPAVLIAALFLPAGRLDLPYFWAYVALMLVYLVVVGFLVMDPELRRERLQPGEGQDRLLRRVALPFSLANLVIAGLDVGRFHFSDSVPAAARLAGVLGMAASLSLAGWAISANRFFSPLIRIQPERGHHVVTSGPYRFIRHPGYLGGIGMSISTAFSLGSWWAMVPLVVPMVLVVRRIVIEDRFLQRELAGYAEYAERVRYRLLPRIW